jgi:hypothetical protein
METTLREFQRDFGKARLVADSGENVVVRARRRRYLFKLLNTPPNRGIYGAAAGLAEIRGNLLSTGLKWESAQ